MCIRDSRRLVHAVIKRRLVQPSGCLLYTSPTASRVLCAFGAEVIKVETKIGDEMRRAGEFEMVVCEDDKNRCV